MTDKQIEELNRGGHDPIKVFNAYNRATNSKNKPSVVLAFTVKGYGMGSRQADNAAHQIKKLSKENLQDFVEHFNLPITEKELDNPSYLSLDSKEEKKYLINQRKKLGGFLPSRKTTDEILSPEDGLLDEFSQQSKRLSLIHI